MGGATPPEPPPRKDAGTPPPSPATVVGYGRRSVEPVIAPRAPASVLHSGQGPVPLAQAHTPAESPRVGRRRWLIRAVVVLAALVVAAIAFVVIQNLPPDDATRVRIQQVSDQVALTITTRLVDDVPTVFAQHGMAGTTIADVMTSCSGSVASMSDASWSCRTTFIANVPTAQVHNERGQMDITATADLRGDLRFQAHDPKSLGPASLNVPVVQQEYLAAVAPYNAALPSLDEKVAAVRATTGCLCGSDLIPVRTAVQQEIAGLTALKSHVPPNIAADVSALVDDKRAMLADLTAMVSAASEASILTQADDLQSRRADDSLAAKVRLDLGLPPPSVTPCNCGL